MFHKDGPNQSPRTGKLDPFDKDWKADEPMTIKNGTVDEITITGVVLMSQGAGLPAKEVPIARGLPKTVGQLVDGRDWLTVAEARAQKVCRICKMSVNNDPKPLTLNFGNEFAHTGCLVPVVAEVSANWRDTTISLGGPPGSDCGMSLEAPGSSSSSQEKRVDPQWDRYFEMTFKEQIRFVKDGEDVTHMVGFCGVVADLMLAERQKRAK